MQRREFVQLIPLMIASSLTTSRPFADELVSAGSMPGQYRAFGEWLKASRAAAMRFVADGGAINPQRFMQFLALWATAMPTPTEPPWQRIQGANRRLEFAMVSAGRPFVVTAFRMEPGCIQPAHCHPGGGGITLCVGGSVAIKHYDLAPGSPDFSNTGAIAQVDEVCFAHLRNNQFTLFTPLIANLHQIQAGREGATCVDLLVQWTGAGEFSYLKLRDSITTSEAALGRRHRGTWTGMDIARAYG